MSLYHLNIVILGAGPAGLGAATRLRQLGFNGHVHIIDETPSLSAPAFSVPDDQGFLWETHGFGIASHHAWVDQVCDAHLAREFRAIETHVHGGEHAQGTAAIQKAYLAKAWVSPLEQLNAGAAYADPSCSAGDRIVFCPPDGGELIKTRLVRTGGMSTLWTGMSQGLPAGWLHSQCQVTGIAPDKRVLHIMRQKEHPITALPYDLMISTIPLCALLQRIGATDAANALQSTYISRIVVGVGLRGSPPPDLQRCEQVLFWQPDVPFHRAVLLSNVAPGYVPAPGETWSAQFDISVARGTPVDLDQAVESTVACLVEKLHWVTRADVMARFATYIEHGLPRPFLQRDQWVDPLLGFLEQKYNILSRGCFGAWRGELAGADHDMMQGAEAVEHMLNGVDEHVVLRPQEAVGKRHTRLTNKRGVAALTGALRFELVVARYKEDIAWLGDYAAQAIIYNKGGDQLPLERYPRQKALRNIGREAHTYLHHIVTNYHQLADTTFFCQGRLDDSIDNFRGLEDVIRRALSNPRDVAVFRRFFIFHWWDGIDHGGKWLQELNAGIMRRSDMTPGQFWQYTFAEPPPRSIVWAWSATFAVRRCAILARPRAFYQRLLDHFERVNHVNPEEGHFMERLWLSIFGACAGAETLAEYGAFVLNAPEREVHTPPPSFRTDMLE